MLYARRRGTRRPRYRISQDGSLLTTWTPLVKGEGGRFLLDGVEYLVDAGGTAAHAVLSLVDEVPVAIAEGLGRTPWTVRTDRDLHVFEPTRSRLPEHLLVNGGRPVGVIRPVGRSGRHAEAELPGLPLPVAVFALAVVITTWTDAVAGRQG